MTKNKKDYKALLTIYGLDKMSPKEVMDLQVWLRRIATQITKEQYAHIAKFRLMTRRSDEGV